MTAAVGPSSGVARAGGTPGDSMRASLPAFASLVADFGLFNPEGSCQPQVASSGDISCACGGCARWAAYVRGQLPGGPTWPQYEVFTAEFVDALATYLRGRAAAYGLPRMRWLEVGASDGRLTCHLRAALRRPLGPLEAPGAQVDLECTDSGANALHKRAACGSAVELEDAAAAVARRRPHGVLCCWQPLGVDWTAGFRACPSVREYVLVGEPDGGICGHPWRTWGARAPQWTSSSASQSSSASTASPSGGSGGAGKAVSTPSQCQPGHSEHARGSRRCIDQRPHFSSQPARKRPHIWSSAARAAGGCAQQLASAVPAHRARLEATGRAGGVSCAALPGGDLKDNGCLVSAPAEQSRLEGSGKERGRSRSARPAPHAPDMDGGRLVGAPLEEHGGSGCREQQRGGPRRACPAPYARDGFERVELPEVSRWQVCRTDEHWLARRHSRSVAFRRSHQAPAACS